MSAISWLAKYRVQSFTRRDHEWIITFDRDAQLIVACLWRLLENGRIRITSEDNGQQFGLPASVNAAEEANKRISGSRIESAELREGTLDLALYLSTGHVFEVIPDSSGYEAWQLHHKSAQFIAVGGGNLALFGNIPAGA